MNDLSGELTGAQRAERGRLGELYLRHGPDALRLAYLLTGDRALAEDLMQEAFARLAGRFLDLRNPDAFGTYLSRTIVNLSRMHFRHKKVERVYLAKEVGLRRSESRDPEVATRETMRRALTGLPARQRAAVVLRYYEDLSVGEIAEVLQCRPGTAKSLVSRGVAALRQNLLRGDEEPNG